MKSGTVSQHVERLIAPILQNSEYELVDIEYVKEGQRWYLRIFIDKPQGMTLDDCEQLSKKISDVLDEKDFIRHSYVLEVSSPGLERPLKKKSDYVRFRGKKVVITTFGPVDGKKEFHGTLGGLENEEVLVENNHRKWSIPLEKIASARLALDL